MTSILPSSDHQGPKTLSYLASERHNIIRDRIAGYTDFPDDPPGTAIISELLQNADDAEATLVRFYFTEEHLRAYNNQYFKPDDFYNIRKTFAASKREEEGKIGAWGTGFLSVYRITDFPMLRSSKQQYTFRMDDIECDETDIDTETDFYLRWRRPPQTDIGDKIGAQVWDENAINQLKRGMGRPIHRMCVFLRHVHTIEVYDGEQTCIFRVARQLIDRHPVLISDCPLLYTPSDRIDEPATYGFTRERWHISYTEGDSEPKTDTWVYYRAHIPPEHRTEGVKIKDTEVALAFPHTPARWTTLSEPARLYNFLPTHIKTDLPFLINGAFFPDSNRHGILIGSTAQGTWNTQVLQSIGQLFVTVLTNLRTNAGAENPQNFYDLLPIKYNRQFPFLATICEQFAQSASSRDIVYSSLKEWVQPHEVKVGKVDDLYRLAEPDIPLLPAGVKGPFRTFLEDRLKVETLDLMHVLTYLQRCPEVRTGVPLGQIRILDSPEKLAIIYAAAAPRYAEKDVQNILRTLPIYLGEDQRLYAVCDHLRCGNEAARSLAFAEIPRFVARELQRCASEFLRRILGNLDGKLLLAHYMPDPLKRPLPLEHAPAFMNTVERLRETLVFLHASLDSVKLHELARHPLVLDEHGRLWPAAGIGMVRLPAEETYNAVLQRLGITLAHPALVQQHEIKAVYSHAGVRQASPQDVITSLMALDLGANPLQVAEVLRLFDYLYIHKQQLTTDNVQCLRKLPLYLTQQGRFAPIERPEGGALKFPQDPEAARYLEILSLDTVLHTDLLQGSARLFLEEQLHVEPLQSLVAIREDVLPHYSDQHLTDAERLSLLEYICMVWASLGDAAATRLPIPTDARLIRGQDGEYYTGCTLYFASSELDEVLPHGYCRPHAQYRLFAGTAERSPWYRFFLEALGVQRQASASDLIASIRRVVESGPPDPRSVERIQRIYRYINGKVRNPLELQPLRELRWLPAVHAGQTEWHTPVDVYQSRHAALVGDQAPILRGFPETTQELRTVIGMPDTPPITLVLDHLFASATAAQLQPVESSVYSYLGRHWKRIEKSMRVQLSTRPVVWDGKKYWPARHAFLSSACEHIFSTRRGYLRQEFTENTAAAAFLKQIGVRPDATFQDSKDVLLEIADDCQRCQGLSPDDRQQVLRIFVALDSWVCKHELKEQDIEGLRSQPIFLTQQNRLVPIDLPDGSSLMRPEGNFRQTIPDELLGADSILHQDLLRGDGGRFLSVLGIDGLSPEAAIRNNLAARYPGLTHEQKLTVLVFLREVWNDMRDSGREGLRQSLVDVPLIRCQDDTYRCGREVYFATVEQEAVFGANYNRPHSVYGFIVDQQRRSEWFQLFVGTRIWERPSAPDLIQAVHNRVLKATGEEQRRKVSQAIYRLINSEIGENKLYGDGTELGELANLAWLPALKKMTWHKPSELYQARYAEIIGDQAPILAFVDTSRALRSLLDMPEDPPIKYTVLHVLSGSQPISERAYAALGTRWGEVEAEIAPELRERLRCEPIIWDDSRQRHWAARDVFYTDYSEYFGAYKCYLKPPGAAVKTCFAQIGVNQYDRHATHTTFLHEIARAYSRGQEINDGLRALLLRNFDHLGRQRDTDEPNADEKALQELPIIPGRNRRLYRPDRILLEDPPQQDIVRLFPSSQLPVIDGEKREGIGLTPVAERYLGEILKVPLLNQVVQRRLKTISGKNRADDLRERLQALVPAFARVERHLRHADGAYTRQDSASVQELSDITLFLCDEVRVEYAFPEGWDMPSQSIPDAAFYDKQRRILYVQEAATPQLLSRRLALALAQTYFNGHEATTVGVLLEQKRLEDACAYLDDFGYPPCLDATIATTPAANHQESTLNDSMHIDPKIGEEAYSFEILDDTSRDEGEELAEDMTDESGEDEDAIHAPQLGDENEEEARELKEGRTVQGSPDEVKTGLAAMLSKQLANNTSGRGTATQSHKPHAQDQQPFEQKPSTPKAPQKLPPIEEVKLGEDVSTDSWRPTDRTGTQQLSRPNTGRLRSQAAEGQDGEVGRRGEELIFRRERERVRQLGYPESRVVWVSDQNPLADHDILSVGEDGEDIWLEVKSTVGTHGRFMWSKGEFERAVKERDRYILWRVYRADTLNPIAVPFADPIGTLLNGNMRLDIADLYAEVEPLSTDETIRGLANGGVAAASKSSHTTLSRLDF